MGKKPIAAGKSSFELIDSQTLFDALALKEDTVFLDLACGKGAYSLAAARYIGEAGHVYAFDLWEEGIDSLRAQMAAQKITNIIADVVDVSERVPLADDTIDVCLMATVLHDLIQDGTDQGALTEVRRVVKPLGRLAVVEFKKINGPPGPPVEIRLSENEVIQHLRPHAFHLEKTVDLGPYNYLSVFTSRKSS